MQQHSFYGIPCAGYISKQERHGICSLPISQPRFEYGAGPHTGSVSCAQGQSGFQKTPGDLCLFYAHSQYRSLELMFIRKTLPAFALATRDRSFVISTRHGYQRSVQALHSTKTNTQEEHVSFSNNISIDFEQTKEAYKSKDTLELLRSLVVFKLCSYDILVDSNKEVCNVFNAYRMHS